MSQRDQDDKDGPSEPDVEPTTSPPEAAASPWPGAGHDTAPAGGADSIGEPEAGPPAGEEDIAGAGPPEPAAAPRPRRRVGTTILVLLVVFLAGVSVWPIFGGAIHGLLPFTWIGGAIDGEARDRLAALEQRVAQLEARPQPTGEDSTARQSIGDLTDRLNAQSEELARLRTALEEQRPEGAPAPSEEMTALRQRLDGLEARMAELASRPPPAAGDGAMAADEVARLREQVASLTRELADSQAGRQTLGQVQQSAAELGRTVSDLAGRLAALEARAGETADRRRREAGVLALTQLAAGLRGRDPFVEQLQAAQALAPGDPELAGILQPVAALAPTGIPSLGDLQARFAAVAAAVVRAAIADAQGGWWERTVNRLASLVTVRRVGEVPGDEPEALVARAEARLQEGDLTQAVELMASLTGPPAAAAADWLAQARQRLAADAAAAKLQNRALTLLGEG